MFCVAPDAAYHDHAEQAGPAVAHGNAAEDGIGLLADDARRSERRILPQAFGQRHVVQLTKGRSRRLQCQR